MIQLINFLFVLKFVIGIGAYLVMIFSIRIRKN